MSLFSLLGKKRHFWLYLVTVVASLGGLLAGFDMGVISGAMLFINTEWILSPFVQGWVVSSAIVGAVIGAAGNGILSDIYGRKKIIIATALIFIAGSVFSAVAPNVGCLIAARMLVGIAVGMVNFIVPIYLSEISPQKIRGMLVSLYQLAITAGILFSYLINGIYADSEYSWRLMMFSGIYPAVILLLGIIVLQDTPRWLISKKRDKEAAEVFQKIEPEIDIKARIKEIKATLQSEQKGKKNRLQFQKWMLMPIFVGVGMMFAQICTGINTVIYYTTTIFKVSGFSENSAAIYATIGVGIVNFLMTGIAIVFTDRLGRKPLLYAGTIGMMLSMLCLGMAFNYADTLGENLRYVATASVMVYIACFAFSLGPVTWIMVSEILPLRIRGLAMSICTVSNFFFNFIIVLSFPVLLQHIGEAHTFWIYAGICFISLFFFHFYVPETKGRSLEEIERNWQQGISARNF